MNAPHRIPAAIVAVIVMLGAVPGSATAQVWQWPLRIDVPGQAPVVARSRVELSPAGLSLTYTARIRGADAPIVSCRANASDIASVQSLQRHDRTYLIVNLKPRHPAACASGSAPAMFAPVLDDASTADAIATIRRVCCTASVAMTAASPSPAAVSSPEATPHPSPARPPAGGPRVADWVVSDGLFAFIRVRNRSDRPVAIAGGVVQNCRAVDAGCGAFPAVTIPPATTVTVATVMSSPDADAATFTYRYDANDGPTRAANGGTSSKAPVGWQQPMSTREIRSAEAAAIADLHGTPSAPSAPSGDAPAPQPKPTPTMFAAARLTHRGTSRLGIGHTGSAQVRVALGADGTPQSAEILKISDRQLAAAAIETAVSSTYEPAFRDGRPVSSTYVATFQFDGDDPALAGIPMWKRDPSPAPSPEPTPS